ncbi:MAG: hypothetical protein WC205_09765 [Opitutaceae bacterium]
MRRRSSPCFKRKLYGTGQSERVDRDQMLLALVELEKLSAQAEAPAQPVSYERRSGKARRDPAEAFAKLPVQETIVTLPEEVKAAPEAYEQIGEERTLEVHVTPPKLFKRGFVRPKYRRKDDASRPPVVARAPARVAAGGYASAGLIAWVVVGKSTPVPAGADTPALGRADLPPNHGRVDPVGLGVGRSSLQTHAFWVNQPGPANPPPRHPVGRLRRSRVV